MTQEFKVDVSGIRTPPRAYHNCTVKTIDTSNNLAEVELPGSDGQRITVGLQGTLDLAVNDVVRVWTSPDFPVGWIDGESPNVPGQAAKISALYNLNLDSIVAETSTDDLSINGDVGINLRGNSWNVPDDHFNSFSGYTWDSVDFDNAPSTVDTATYSSLLRLMNDNITEDHFAYKVKTSSESIIFTARMSKGVDSYIGLRCDNENDNDYFEMRIIDGTDTGTIALQRRHRVSGGSVTESTIMDNIEAQFITVRLLRGSPTDLRWYYSINMPIYYFIASQAPSSVTWTDIRYGIIFGQRGFVSNADRAGFVDWAKEG